MLLSIEDEAGRRSEAMLLAAGKDRMRLAPRGSSDTLELTMVAETWYDERGRRVTIAAILALDGADCSDFCADVYPRVATAGQNWN
jgi:hypothetical protein